MDQVNNDHNSQYSEEEYTESSQNGDINAGLSGLPPPPQIPPPPPPISEKEENSTPDEKEDVQLPDIPVVLNEEGFSNNTIDNIKPGVDIPLPPPIPILPPLKPEEEIIETEAPKPNISIPAPPPVPVIHLPNLGSKVEKNNEKPFDINSPPPIPIIPASVDQSAIYANNDSNDVSLSFKLPIGIEAEIDENEPQSDDDRSDISDVMYVPNTNIDQISSPLVAEIAETKIVAPTQNIDDSPSMPVFRKRTATYIKISNIIKDNSMQSIIKEPKIEVTPTDIWLNDETIFNNLTKANPLKEFIWGKNLVGKIKKTTNPLCTSVSSDFYITEGYGNNNIVKLFAQDCQMLKISPANYSIPEFKPTRKIVYQSEVISPTEKIIPNRNIECSISHDLLKLYNIESIQQDNRPISVFKRPISDYLMITNKSFSIRTVGFIEPIYVVASLFQKGKIISEQWSFIPSDSSRFFFDANIAFNNNLKAAFEIVNDDSQYEGLDNQPYVVFSFRRALMVDNGNDINQYYINPSQKNKLKAEKCLSSWPRTKDIFSTFAYSIVPLKLFEKHSISVTNPHIIDRPLNSELISQLIEKPSKRSSEQLPFVLEFECQSERTDDPYKYEINDFFIVQSLITPPQIQAFTFRHQFDFKLNYVNMNPPKGIKARNVFAKISLHSAPNGESLPLIYSPLTGEKTSVINTCVWYHKTNPTFSDIYVCDIPVPVPNELCFKIEFFHGIAQEAGPDAYSFIGSSIIRLLDENGCLVSKSNYQEPITFANKEMNIDSFASFGIIPQSRIISADNRVNVFINNAINHKSLMPELLHDCTAVSLFHSILPLLEIITSFMSQQPLRAITSLIIMSRIIQPKIGERFESILNSFAIHHCFHDTEIKDPVFHTALMCGYSEYLQSNLNENDKRIEVIEIPIIRFIFSLIIKSIKLTKDRTFMRAFELMTEKWVKTLTSYSFDQIQRRNSLFSVFINMLFDIDAFTAVPKSLVIYSSVLNLMKNEHAAIFIDFFSQVIRPKMFIISSIFDYDMLKVFNLAVKHSLTANSPKILENLYTIFIRTTTYFSPDLHKRVASCYIGVLGQICPLDIISFVNGNQPHAILFFFTYLITYVNHKQFMNWWKDSNRTAFFKSLHFILTKISPDITFENREIVYSLHNGVIRFMQIANDFTEKEDIAELSNIYYHLLCIDKSIDLLQPLVASLSQFLSKNLPVLFFSSRPVLPKIISKVLIMSSIIPDSVSCLIDIIFDSDKAEYNSTNRSMAVFSRALSIMSIDERISLKVSTNSIEAKPFTEMVNKLISIENDLKKELLIDEVKAEKVYNRAVLLMSSPDASYEVFTELAEFYRKKYLFDEELQVLIVQAALIIEYSTTLGKMKNIWGTEITHAGSVFEAVCPSVPFVFCPNKIYIDIPKIPSYCDSPMFTERGFMQIMMFILKRCQDMKLYEIGYSLIDILWPILENHRMFFALRTFFQNERSICSRIESVSEERDRNYGAYFSVTCIGALFSKENGTPFIYKEAQGTTLTGFSSRILQHYKAVFGENSIIHVDIDKQIDYQNLESDKGYIQIIPLKPNFTLKELSQRLSVFEQQHNLFKFSQDYIYYQNPDSEVNADYKDQWIRRQILEVTKPMPTCLIRQVVLKNNISEKEYSPIRVAYRKLSSRIEQLKGAIDTNEYHILQNLLKESLLVISNDCPTRMIKDFLDNNMTDKSNKHYQKLSNASSSFIIICEQGLLTHAKFVALNPKYIPIQNELESSFQSMKDAVHSFG